jgi:hypothetical protein
MAPRTDVDVESDTDSEPPPWYRTQAAMFTAGGLGLLFVAILVWTVVQMSGEWSTPSTTVFTTPATPAAPVVRSSTTALIATPSDSSTSYSRIPLSTTDIGLPGAPPESSSGTSGTSSPTRSGSSHTTERRTDDDDNTGPTSGTRQRPRLNETRTLYPAPRNVN